MPNQTNGVTAATFTRDSSDPSVAVLDGYGLTLKVRHGHLIAEDGIGRHRRLRTYARAQRKLRRVVILGHTGFITLEAIGWCADLDIAIEHIDNDGRLLTMHGPPGRNDPRLRRAQGAAATSDVGLEIGHLLLGGKLGGQTAVLGDLSSPAAELVRDLASELRTAADLIRCRDLEAQASNAYFAAWSGTVACRFAARDQPKVPEHWQRFNIRSSPLHRGGRSPRNAADPINALLNYGYALAETESRLAALALGLDPGLGIVHTDKLNRDSLALDLLEPLRPHVDAAVLRLLETRHFNYRDFHETRQGACRILAPLTHNFAEDLLPTLARAVAPIAETVTHLLAGSSPHKIALYTPLSRTNNTRTQTPGARSARRRPPTDVKLRPTCRNCGVDLYGSARKLCPTCWPVARAEFLRQLGKARAKPPGPPKPTTEELSGGWTFEDYQTRILPALKSTPLGEIERVTGLCNASCSRLRRGLQVPNPRLWDVLADLAAVER